MEQDLIKVTPEDIKTMSDVRRYNKLNGGYFFASKTMKFFQSKIESSVIKKKYFITSERKGLGMTEQGRHYSIREIVYPDIDIKTVQGDFTSKEQAKQYIKDFLS